MILETKYGDPPKPSCSIALVALVSEKLDVAFCPLRKDWGTKPSSLPS